MSNLNDSGPGSLRQAVIDANTAVGPDFITFAPGLTGIIHLTSGEIAITDSVDIQGPGARILAIDSTARIFNISGGGSVNVTISDLTLTGANANGNGGAISNNSANVTLRFVTLLGNTASGEGGAIYNLLGVFRIENSTLASNKANKAGAIYSIGFRLDIINSTISDNMATDSVGGIKLEFAFAGINNSTINGNHAGFSQGGILAGTGNNQLDLVSVIAANNTDVTGASDLARFAGIVNASNSLFEQNVSTGPGGAINGTNSDNLIGVDPLIGPLLNNGGPTNTQALLPGSPAIDQGSNPLDLLTDQRGPGYPREIGAATDIGAFELGPSSTAPTLSSLGLSVLVLVLLSVGVQWLRRELRSS